MSYLARLKILLSEKPLPEELTEPTKGASVASVSDRGSRLFEGSGPCVSFVSDQRSHLPGDETATETASVADETAIEERAGLAADNVPEAFLDGWARLNHQKPFDVSDADWRLGLDDGGRFLDAWGHDAAALGWTPGDLFDAPSKSRAGGLVWELKGDQVTALGDDRARLRDGRTITRRART